MPKVNSQSKIAVLIANQDYLHTSKLKTPISEIDTLNKICNLYGFKTLVFKNVIFSDYNLIFDSIERVLTNGAFLYIHYAGHGVQLDGENYIVPIDAHPKSITQAERQCIPVSNFFKLINDYQISHDIKSLLCFDACRDNPFKGIVGNIVIGFRKIDFSPINTGIIYSCAAGKTALDGKKDYSPFAKVWIDQIQNCNFSINEISAMIDGELLKSGLIEERLPERRFVGMSSVYFCSQDHVVGARKKESQLLLLNSLLDNIDMDFSNEQYFSIIGKSKWIDSLLNNNKELKQYMPFEDYLRLKYFQSKAYFEINDFENSERGFENLWSVINGKKDKIQDNLFYDSYFYLGRLYTLHRKWDKIKEIRTQFLAYNKANGNILDIITTYDKIAGDYERENKLDSARIYYSLCYKEADKFEISNSYEASCVASFYNNRGKFHVWQDEPNVGLKSLLKAYNIYKIHNLSNHYIIYDLADYYINYKNTFNKDSALKYLVEYKIATGLNSLIDRLNYLLLDVNLKVQIENFESINCSLELYYNELNKLLDLKIIKDDVGLKSFDSVCNVPYWTISFRLPKDVYPLIFIDKNLIKQYDEQDLILTPVLKELKSTSALEISASNTKETSLVIYQDYIKMPNSGIVYIQRNILNEYFGLSHQSNLTNSTVEFHEVGNFKDWSFTIFFSDIKTQNKPEFYIGGTNLTYNNNYLIRHSESITIFPAKDGANYIINAFINK